MMDFMIGMLIISVAALLFLVIIERLPEAESRKQPTDERHKP